MAGDKKDILVVCGPTATGKTHLAVQLALEMGAEILSADSRQVYKGMDIGTGKDLEEYTTPKGPVQYHLVDIVDPEEVFSLAEFQRSAYAAIREIRGRGRVPLMAGGTGLYIEAVLKNYQIPNVPEDTAFRAARMGRSRDELEEELRTLDRALYQKTDTSTKKRIVRALEIARYAKDHIVEWGEPNPPAMDPLVLCVRFERREIWRRIDKRLDERLASGMVDEVRRLIDRGVSRRRLSLFGMEYNHIARYLFGEVDYSTMVERLRFDIHRFAKRQDTYFRGMERRGIAVHWVDNGDYGIARETVSRHFGV